MAQQQSNTGSTGTTNMLTGGMVRDNISMLKKEHSYTFARNATVVLSDGQRGAISAEQANSLCTSFPYQPIAFIHIIDDQWAVFLTDDIHSEIGIFYEDQCKYESLTKGSQPCLNFNRNSLITGAARRGFDCGFNIYWSDGRRNPDRTLNTAKVPWVQDCSSTPVGATCVTCVDTNVLDCEKLRLAPLYSIPCLELAKGTGGGTLLSGSYQIAVAYTIGEIRVTDYCTLSNVQSIFDHSGTAGGLNLKITGAEQSTFSEMEIVIVSSYNGQTQAKRLGTYSTRQTTIYIDDIDQTLPTIPLSVLPVSNPAIESSDSIWAINNYLCRLGPQEQPDFNYQPLANQIQVNYAVVAYPEDYYQKGGSSLRTASGDIITYPMNVGYLRDEVYATFIQWCYTTGEYSAAYHIPGSILGPTYSVIDLPTVEGSLGVVAHGRMGYYESEERYPDNQPTVWGALCGQKIRHHRFPSQTEFGVGSLDELSHYSHPYTTPDGRVTNNIQVMAWYFTNIQLPVDNNGNVIPNIQGYRILRASREGHMSILAKGMVNSMRGYDDPYSGRKALYQNYPYNDLTPDYFMTSNYNTVRVGQPNTALNPSSDNFTDPLTTYYNNILSFHSPDTVFSQPYLGLGTLKTEMVMSGTDTGYFRQAYRHGNFKTLTNFNTVLADFLAAVDFLIGLYNVIVAAAGGTTPNVTVAATEDVPLEMPIQLANDYQLIVAGTDTSIPLKSTVGTIVNIAIYILWSPIRFKALQQQILTLLKTFAPARAFAWQWDSHGFYGDFIKQYTSAEYNIQDYSYIKGEVQSFADMEVNNLWRNKYVALQLSAPIANLYGLEKSRYTMTERGVRPQDNDSVIGPFTDSLYSFYASYKVPQLTQYGQIGSTKNIPISCVYQVDTTSNATYTSPVVFGGDTYINRYTEKNPFYYFNDWLVNAPPDYEYNYRNYINQPYPRYWIDNTLVTLDILGIMSRLRHLDAQVNAGNINLGLFSISTYVMNGAFYLFNNGVRDFFVESSVNVGYRDWEDPIPKRFYDPYGFTDISLMFRSDYLKEDPNIYYKYDQSLSASKIFNQYISWAQTLRRDYDPDLAYTCFDYMPRKLMYSLPQQEEGRRDNWRIFLPNNYEIFNNKPVAIQAMNKTGALLLFEDASPGIYPGVDSIPSQMGTDYSVGTGVLFRQPMQSVSNTQDGVQYGSCQNRLSVINTPVGVFWVSRDAGKIFQYNGQLKDITNAGIKAWCSLYLPSQTIAAAPTFPLQDNPITGVGVQTTYDGTNEIIYFSKKDYVPTNATYSNGQWYAGPCPPGYVQSGVDPVTNKPRCRRCIEESCKGIPIEFGDPRYFSPASWTLSYDIKAEQWIGYHDWWPDLTVLSSQHFLTTQGNSIYRHNTAVDSYTTYYGIPYPFEIEVPITTGPSETILSSVEYLMDSYRYLPNGIDKVQLFDGAFNYAMVYNPEQNTGIMPLTLQPFNDPYLALTYPIPTATGPNILYDKVENRYRFNGFYDLTNDRNRFTPGLVPAILTDATGYRFSLNNTYFDYLKNPLQQKRLRYQNTSIWLRRVGNNSNSCSIRYVTTRNIISRR